MFPFPLRVSQHQQAPSSTKPGLTVCKGDEMEDLFPVLVTPVTCTGTHGGGRVIRRWVRAEEQSHGEGSQQHTHLVQNRPTNRAPPQISASGNSRCQCEINQTPTTESRCSAPRGRCPPRTPPSHDSRPPQCFQNRTQSLPSRRLHPHSPHPPWRGIAP